ncbi:MAG: geranylgeranylglycerol-phosphate geranylgeranyltransferase [Halobacteriaceae archaeon]
MRGRETVVGVVDLLRVMNAVAAGVLTVVGAFVAGGLAAHPVDAGLAGVATVLATGAGNAINDYFDRDIDRVNDPDRPIPRGAVTPRTALGVSVALFVVAVGLVLALPVLAIAIAVLNLVALVAYTELFKGLPGVGNAVVAYLGGSTFLFGAAAVEAVGVTAAVLAGLAALATFGREIIKDIEDMAGDRDQGLHTLPIVVGDRRALAVAAVVVGVAVIASPLPYAVGALGLAYLVVVVPADLVMLVGLWRSIEDPGRGHRLLKWGMFIAGAAFVVGRIAVLEGGWP